MRLASLILQLAACSGADPHPNPETTFAPTPGVDPLAPSTDPLAACRQELEITTGDYELAKHDRDEAWDRSIALGVVVQQLLPLTTQKPTTVTVCYKYTSGGALGWNWIVYGDTPCSVDNRPAQSTDRLANVEGDDVLPPTGEPVTTPEIHSATFRFEYVGGQARFASEDGD